MSHTATPFDALLGIKPGRLPQTTQRATVVLAGQRVKTARDIPAASDEPQDAEARLELKRARDRARYQRDRQNPQAMAKRQAWLEANREKVRAYKRDYDRKHRERMRDARASWAKKDYHANPDKHRAKQRDYYERHRDEILARLKAKRDAAKAAKESA